MEDNTKKKTTSLYIEEDLYDRFKNAVAGRFSRSDVISQLIRSWLSGEIQISIEPVEENTWTEPQR